MTRSFWTRTAAVAATLAAAGTATLLPANHAAADTAQTGTVTAKTSLAQRSGPSQYAPVGGPALAKGAKIKIDCNLDGTTVGGNEVWYKIAGSRTWVAARYVKVAKPVEACNADHVIADKAAKATAGLNIRKGPSTSDRKEGSVAKGGQVSLDCRVNGSFVTGPNGKRSNVWYSVTGGEGSHGGYVSAAYIKTAKQIPYCSLG